LSVTVIVHAAVPVDKVAVAAVLEVTVGVPMLSPLQPDPLTLNNVLAVSELHNVFAPVSVRLGVVPVLPLVGERDSVAVATVIVVVIESVVSEIVSVPVPEPVVMTKVCDVAELFVELTSEAPVTPEMVKLVLLVQEVLLPVQVSVMLPLWWAGTAEGEQVKLAPARSAS